MIYCQLCNKSFNRKMHLEYHLINNVCLKDTGKFKCAICPKKYKTMNWLNKHMKICTNISNKL